MTEPFYDANNPEHVRKAELRQEDENKDIEFIIVDKDKNKQGKTWRGIEIHDPDIIPGLINPKNTYIASSYRNQNDIKDALINYGVAEEAIITLYDHINVY